MSISHVSPDFYCNHLVVTPHIWSFLMDYPPKCKVKCSSFFVLFVHNSVYFKLYESYFQNYLMLWFLFVLWPEMCISATDNVECKCYGACGLSMYQFNLHENSNLIPAALIFSEQPLNSRMSTHPCLTYQNKIKTSWILFIEYLFSLRITCNAKYASNHFLSFS